MKTTLIAGFAALALSSLAFGAEARLNSVDANGTGCPIQDGKAIPYSFDGQWLTFELNKAFAVKVVKGKGISLEESRRNCSFTVDLETPGYRYAIDRVVTSGSYQLGDNDQFVSTFDGFFQGDGATANASAEVNGPVKYSTGYKFDRTPNLVWSDCNPDRVVTLNAAVRVAPNGGNGTFATSSSGTLDRVAFHVIFKKCN